MNIQPENPIPSIISHFYEILHQKIHITPITLNKTKTSKQFALEFINSINIHEQKLFIDRLSLDIKIKIKSVVLVDKNTDVM